MSAISFDPTMIPKCKECGSMDIDYTFKWISGILVCEKCKTEILEKYSLLTKTVWEPAWETTAPATLRVS